MRWNKKHQLCAQTMMEYSVLMIIVVAIVFGAFANKGGGLIDTTRSTAEGYFTAGSRAISGGYYENNAFHAIEFNR